jgi:hypothetical protein
MGKHDIRWCDLSREDAEFTRELLYQPGRSHAVMNRTRRRRRIQQRRKLDRAVKRRMVQRQELRALRDGLRTARERTRRAREDARRMRADLRESEPDDK